MREESVPFAVRRMAAAAVVAAVTTLLLGCGASVARTGGDGAVQVVAVENFWGSIAAQLGGAKVHVTTIIDNPDADPHDYEPTAANARAIAGADYVILNGAGYDAWASKLLESNPSGTRRQLVVGDLVGVGNGGNPHLWYSPTFVHRVVARVTSDLKKVDAKDARYFDQRRAAYDTTGLATYDKLRADIRQRFANAPVGATESIFVYLAHDLGLDLTTPPGFMNAISEGDDPTARDKATVDAQIGQRRIDVLVYNRQNSTPDVNALVDKARSEKIPVVSITETLEPRGATFQQWQSTQLKSLDDALARSAP